VGDPVFEAFCADGLWPGLGRTLTEALPGAGIAGPDDVTAEKLAALPKVGTIRAGRLLSAWIGAAHVYEVAQLIVPAGLRARVAARAVDAFGDDAARRLRDDPWLLLQLPDVRVVEADRVAVAALPGVRRDDPRRGRALVAHALNRAARDGHTVQPVELVLAALGAEGVADPPGAVAAAIEAGIVHETAGTLSLQRLAMAESAVAEAVARLTATAEPIEPEDAGDALDDLDDTQRGAVETVLRHGVSVLTGGPGTGKSRTVAALVRLAEKQGLAVALAAPTGRAAKRLEELGDAPAATLHRLLGAQGRTGGFARGEEWPLDAELVVVDETSMLDVELAAALLEACADGTHLLLVGDPAQLPSIGPGRVLADLVESGTVPVIELTTLYRQAAGGAIARLATAVRAGDLPPVDAPDREVVLVRATGSAEAAHRVVQLVTDSIPGRLDIPAGDGAGGDAGAQGAGRHGRAQPGPQGGAQPRPRHGLRVRPRRPGGGDRQPPRGRADRVRQRRGRRRHRGQGRHRDGRVRLRPGRRERAGAGRPAARLGDHRAPRAGLEWPAVVAVLPPEAGGMLSRPLVYTALTRAQRHLSVVPAVGPALARAVRDVGARPRRTRLRELLADELQESSG
jgi:exodeoxyribonuclease V alpha subunit